MNRCSIVIRSFNEERHIGRLLAGIAQQQDVNAQVIVVDSGSTDATVAIAKQFECEIVSISPKDFTFGRALNLGIQEAQEELVVLASAHVYPVYRDWLNRLIQPLLEQEQVSVAYGRQVGNEVTRFSEHRIFAQWFPARNVEQASQNPFCNNANAAIRRSVWQQYRYDENLTGLEDLDFASRTIRDGFKIAYVPTASVVHVHEETAARIYNRYRREANALAKIMPGQRMSIFQLMRLWTGNTFSDYFHAACEGVFLKNMVDIPLFRGMQFLGAYKGFREHGHISDAVRRRFYYPASFERPAAEPRPSHCHVNYSSDPLST